MREEQDPMIGTQACAAVLGTSLPRSSAPRAEDGQNRLAPAPAVVGKPTRLPFSAEYRRPILSNAARPIRRERLYTSPLAASSKSRRSGSLQGLTATKRGASPADYNSFSPKLRQLEAKVARLEKERATTHTILEAKNRRPPDRQPTEILR